MCIFTPDLDVIKICLELIVDSILHFMKKMIGFTGFCPNINRVQKHNTPKKYSLQMEYPTQYFVKVMSPDVKGEFVSTKSSYIWVLIYLLENSYLVIKQWIGKPIGNECGCRGYKSVWFGNT